MRRLKATAAAAVLGFLAFAPPGTLVLAVLLLAGVVEGTWVMLIGAGALAAVSAIWLARRRRRRAPRTPEET